MISFKVGEQRFMVVDVGTHFKSDCLIEVRLVVVYVVIIRNQDLGVVFQDILNTVFVLWKIKFICLGFSVR